MQDKQLKKLKRLANLIDKKEVGILEELDTLEEKSQELEVKTTLLEENLNSTQNALISHEKEMGATISQLQEEKLSKEDIEALKPILTGDKGDKGDDYVLTEQDKDEIATLAMMDIEVPVVEKIIEKVEVIREQPIEITKEIKIENEETAEETVDKLNTLENKLEPKVLKGWKDIDRIIKSNAKTYTGVSETRVRELIQTSSPLTTKGDLYGFSTVDARIPVGVDNYVLTADSTDALGVSWQPPQIGGKFTYYWTPTASDVATYYVHQDTPYATIDNASFVAATNGQLLRTYITPSSQPSLTFIPAGEYRAHIHANVASITGKKDTYLRAEIWETTSAGVDIVKLADVGPSTILTAVTAEYIIAYTSPQVNLASSSSRIATKVYAVVSGTGGQPDITISVGDGSDSNTTFPSVTVSANNFVTINTTQTVTGTKTFSNQITGTLGYVGSDLTASSPVFTDASKKLTSTGVVPVANGGFGNSMTRQIVATTSSTALTPGYINLTAATFTLSGIDATGVEDGEMTFIYPSGGTLTVIHQNGAATAANRIITPTNSNVAVRIGSVATFRYNATSSRWILQGIDPITSATSPLLINSTTGALSIPSATASVNGYLSSSNWNTFNNKIGGSGGVNSVPYFSSTTNISGTTADFSYNPSNKQLGVQVSNTTSEAVGHFKSDVVQIIADITTYSVSQSPGHLYAPTGFSATVYSDFTDYLAGDVIDYRITAYENTGTPIFSIVNTVLSGNTIVNGTGMLDGDRVDLTWTDDTTGTATISGYVIERQVNGGGYNDGVDVGYVNSYTDNGSGWGGVTVTPVFPDFIAGGLTRNYQAYNYDSTIGVFSSTPFDASLSDDNTLTPYVIVHSNDGNPSARILSDGFGTFSFDYFADGTNFTEDTNTFQAGNVVVPTTVYANAGMFESHGSSLLDKATLVLRSLDGAYSRLDFLGNAGTRYGYIEQGGSNLRIASLGGATLDFSVVNTSSTFSGNVTATAFIKSGGVSTEFLKADGSVDTTSYGTFTLPTLTAGSVLFSDGATIAEDNASFFWDNTNKFLGVGTNIPAAKVDILSTTEQLRQSYDASNYFSTTVDADGKTIFDTFGTSPEFFIGTPSVGKMLTFRGPNGDTIIQEGGRLDTTRATFYLNYANARNFDINNGQFYFTDAGSLGIGTTNPQYGKLDVAGLITSENLTTTSGTNDYFKLLNTASNDASRSMIVWAQTSGSYTMGRFGTEWNLARTQNDFVWRDQYNGGASSAETMRLTGGGKLGIGTGTTVSAFLHTIGTTEQLRLGYDTSNYLSTTVSSAGLVTFNAVGSGSEFLFSDRVREPGTFAEIYVADASTAQTIATGATYTKLTAFTTNGSSSNATADQANDKITLTKAGKYLVTGMIDVAINTANTEIDLALFAGGSIQNNIKTYLEFQNVNVDQELTITGIISVAANTDIDLRVRHDDAGSVDVTVENANLTISYLGE